MESLQPQLKSPRVAVMKRTIICLGQLVMSCDQILYIKVNNLLYIGQCFICDEFYIVLLSNLTILHCSSLLLFIIISLMFLYLIIWSLRFHSYYFSESNICNVHPRKIHAKSKIGLICRLTYSFMYIEKYGQKVHFNFFHGQLASTFKMFVNYLEVMINKFIISISIFSSWMYM